MNDMTETQWGRLFLALGQVPTVDAAMNLDRREVAILHELALKGLDWQQRGFLHCGTGDRADAMDLAQALSINPATGEHQPGPTEAEMDAQIKREQIDAFLDDLAHEGE